MKQVTLNLLAAATVGVISIGSAQASPVKNLAGPAENHVQTVRVSCDHSGRCQNAHVRHFRHSYGYDRQPSYTSGQPNLEALRRSQVPDFGFSKFTGG